ncbi:hypothetical protein BDZ91DRAFT_750654 [Kalaharituber pfeilii]|nr:hypothetical protein BDZ91DRAFT_750654 [Kalaharituber pfeilii]
MARFRDDFQNSEPLVLPVVTETPLRNSIGICKVGAFMSLDNWRCRFSFANSWARVYIFVYFDWIDYIAWDGSLSLLVFELEKRRRGGVTRRWPLKVTLAIKPHHGGRGPAKGQLGHSAANFAFYSCFGTSNRNVWEMAMVSTLRPAPLCIQYCHSSPTSPHTEHLPMPGGSA